MTDSKTLISKLKTNTESGKLAWTKTDRVGKFQGEQLVSGQFEGEFKTELAKGAIIICYDSSLPHDESIWHECLWVELSILNERGEVVDSLKEYDNEDQRMENDDQFGKLLNLHQLARKQYFKADETIDSILNDLD
jgi:hypothetical protein